MNPLFIRRTVVFVTVGVLLYTHEHHEPAPSYATIPMEKPVSSLSTGSLSSPSYFWGGVG